MQDLILTGLLVLVTAVWGWTFTVVKEGVASYGVIGFLAVRFLIAAVCLAALSWRRVTNRSLLVGSWFGVILAVGYLFQTYGLRYTTATNSGLVTSLFVVFAPVANRVLFGVHTPPVLWGAISLSLLGLGLLTGTGPDPLALGDLLTLGAAASYGIHIALLGRCARDHDPMALATAQVASGAIVFFAVWPWTEPFSWPSGSVWFGLAVTGIVATAAGFYVQILAQRRLPASRVAIILTLEAVFAMVFGHLLSGDRLAGGQVLGAALMLGAIALAEIRPALLLPSAVGGSARTVPGQIPVPSTDDPQTGAGG